MLVYDFWAIGNRFLSFRKKAGYTQAEVAEKAGLSDRTYADIERGTVNMRIETLLRICEVLKITPNEIFVEEDVIADMEQNEIIERLNSCLPKDRKTALRILSAFLQSIE